MSRRGTGRHRAVSAVLASAVLAAAAVGVGPAAPAAATGPASVSAYEFVLRAGAAENFVHFFHEIVQGAGFSRVALSREVGVSNGRSEAVGAGVWTFVEDEPCLLGCDPPCTSPAIGNPTMARASNPRSCADQKSGLFVATAGPPGLASAAAPETGSAAGHVLESTSFPGVRIGAAGSDVTAGVARDGVYTGTARAWLANLVTGSGEVRSVTSLMKITARPDGSVPTVSYAFSVAGIANGGSRAGVDEQGFTLLGEDIPAVDIVRWFNDEVSRTAGVASLLGQLGVRLLAPELGLSDDGVRYRITSPVIVVGAEQGLLTQGLTVRSSGVRLAGGVFEGSYAPPDRAMR